MPDFHTLQAWGNALFEGENVLLRELRDDDLPILTTWMNTSGNAILQTYRVVKQPTALLDDLLNKEHRNDSAFACGYCITDKNGQLVGSFTLEAHAPMYHIFELGIMIGPGFQGKGFGFEACQMALRLAFEEMRAYKVALKVWSFNERAIRFYERLGFKEEGRLRAVAFHRSDYFDEVNMGMLASEYQALKSTHE
ncbi:Spermidine N(1)-acetyltransferase [Halomonadaceae bacterium LMG 33818]|uniref:GNAT family N-acetyltransferase n=1 Tax=Cernens ardua TaxID=3402176 RepID=UPI003EDBFAC6